MSFNFDQITEDLFVGGRFYPGDWHILAALNITVDLNLQAEEQDNFMGTSPEVYLWLPAPDWFGPSASTIATGARFIRAMIEDGRKIYVHCNAGIGRAPVVAAAYLITTGMSVHAALELLRTQRPKINPNNQQLQQLRLFAAGWQSD